LSIVALAAGVLALTDGDADAITVTFNDLTDTVSADVTDVPAGVTISITSPVPGAFRVVITGAFVPPEELTDGSATNYRATADIWRRVGGPSRAELQPSLPALTELRYGFVNAQKAGPWSGAGTRN